MLETQWQLYVAAPLDMSVFQYPVQLVIYVLVYVQQKYWFLEFLNMDY